MKEYYLIPLYTLTLVLLSITVLGQPTPEQDLKVVTELNATFNTTKFTFVQTYDDLALDVVVHDIEYVKGYYEEHIEHVIKPMWGKLTDLGYVYVKVRFTNGKYFYGLENF